MIFLLNEIGFYHLVYTEKEINARKLLFMFVILFAICIMYSARLQANEPSRTHRIQTLVVCTVKLR